MTVGTGQSLLPRHGLAFLYCALAAAVSTGCDSRRVEESRTEERRVTLAETGRLVDVHIADGSITVRPASGDSVELTIRSVARSVDRDAALGLLERHTASVVETSAGLEVRGPHGSTARFTFGGVETHVSLAVPAELELRLRTDDGRIEIEDVTANLSAVSGNGRIRARNVRGRVVLEAWDGSIVARDIDGELEASSEDGSVEVDGRFDVLRVETADGRLRVVCRDGSELRSPWFIRSADGSIVLELPDDLNASLEALANDGRIENDLASFTGSAHPFRLEGELGEGGEELFVTTLEGSISLR